MKSLNVNPILFFISTLFILFSCNPYPDDSLGETSLKEILLHGSQGTIVVNSFTKTNGLKREVMGLPIYTMEFTAQIKFEESCWNEWNPIKWMFSNNQRFYKDALVEIEGEINYEKTEQGWRKTDYKISKANILNNPNPADKFIGTWVPVSSKVYGKYKIKRQMDGDYEYFEITDDDGLFYGIGEEENGVIKFKWQGDSNEWNYGGIMQLTNNGQTLVSITKYGNNPEFKAEYKKE